MWYKKSNMHVRYMWHPWPGHIQSVLLLLNIRAKNSPFSATKPILFEAEKYSNDLSPN